MATSSYRASEPDHRSIDAVPNVVLRPKTGWQAVPNERRSSMIEGLMRHRRDNTDNHPKGYGVVSSSTYSHQSTSGGLIPVVDLPIIVGDKPIVSTMRPPAGDVKDVAGVAGRRRSSCYQSVILSGPFSSSSASTSTLLRSGDRASASSATAFQSRRNSLSAKLELKKNGTDSSSTSSSRARAGVVPHVGLLTDRQNNHVLSKTPTAPVAINGAAGSLIVGAADSSERNGINDLGVENQLLLDCSIVSPDSLQSMPVPVTTYTSVMKLDLGSAASVTKLLPTTNANSQKKSGFKDFRGGSSGDDDLTSNNKTETCVPTSPTLEVPRLDLGEPVEDDSLQVLDEIHLSPSATLGVHLDRPKSDQKIDNINHDLPSSPTVEVPLENIINNTNLLPSPSAVVADDHQQTSSNKITESLNTSLVEVLRVDSEKELDETDVSVSCSPQLQGPPYDHVCSKDSPLYVDVPIQTLDAFPSINLSTFPTIKTSFDADNQASTSSNFSSSTPEVPLHALEQVSRHIDVTSPTSSVDSDVVHRDNFELGHNSINMPCSPTLAVQLDGGNHVPSINLLSFPGAETPSGAYNQVCDNFNTKSPNSSGFEDIFDQALSHPISPCSSTCMAPLDNFNHVRPISPTVEFPVDAFDQVPSNNSLNFPTVEPSRSDVHNNFSTSSDIKLLHDPTNEVLLHAHDEVHTKININLPSRIGELLIDSKNKAQDTMPGISDLPIRIQVDGPNNDLSEVVIKKGDYGLGFCIGERIDSAGKHSIFVKRVFTRNTCVQGCLVAGDQIVRVNDIELQSISSAPSAWTLIKSISNEPIRLLVRRNHNSIFH